MQVEEGYFWGSTTADLSTASSLHLRFAPTSVEMTRCVCAVLPLRDKMTFAIKEEG